MITSTHPCREELFAFLVGTLSEEAADTLADHVESCTVCQTALATMDESEDELVAMLRRQEGAGPYAREPQCQAAIERVRTVEGALVTRGGGGDEPVLNPAILLQLGEYEVLEKLGQGGMGAVYKARHTRLKRIVALKVLPPEKTDDPRAIARFEREMEAVGQLVHPNIVQAHDARKIDGTYLLVMEYVDGIDLAEVSRRLGPLAIAEACELVRQAALGLQYAHEHGLVHRDIKPSNLMLHPSNQTPGGAAAAVKILDLGLALLIEERRDAAVEGELTTAGHPMGTADYIAPEQADDAHSVDIRADVYSLGCTLYKLLTGRAPFSGPPYRTAFDKMMAHCRDPITPIRQVRDDVPEELEAVLQRMLAKEPAERFATPGELAAAIAPLAAGADLAALLARADQQAESPQVTQPPSCTTIPQASSAVQGTDPLGLARRDAAAEPVDAETITLSPKPRFARLRRVPRWAIAAGFLPLLLLLGVVLLIDNTRIEVPDGSEVQVARDGTVTVTLPDGQVQVTRPQPQAAPKRGAQPAATDGQPPSAVPGRVVLTPEPLEIASGEPLSRNALVLQPARLEGLQSWTIETIAHRGSNPVAAFSPDGQTVATICTDPTVRFWNVADGTFLRAIVAHDLSISGLAWCPDGSLLATASADRTVRIWDVASGRRLATFAGKSAFSTIDWSSDPRYLAAGCSDGTVHFWEFTLDSDDADARTRREGWRPVTTGVRTREVPKQGDSIRALQWSPDGKMLATAGIYIVKLWDGHAGTPIPSFQFGKSHAGWSALAWSPDGTRIVIARPDGSPHTGQPQFWSAVTGELLSTGPDGMLATKCLAWSPDGKMVAGWDTFPQGPHSPFSFEADSGNIIVRKSVAAWSCSGLVYSPDSRLLAVSRHMGKVEFCDARSIESLHVLPAHTAQVRLAAWAPGGSAISTSSSESKVLRLVQVTSARSVWETLNRTEAVHLTWLSDRQRLAMSNVVFDGVSGRQVLGLERMPYFSHAACSPTVAVVATYNPPGFTRLDVTQFIDISTGELLREFAGYGQALTWSSDGKSVALGFLTPRRLRPRRGTSASWLGRPTGDCWRPAWTTARFMCSTSIRARCNAPGKATPARSCRWPGSTTAQRWLPARRPKSAFGTPRAICCGRSPTTAAPSRPMAARSPRAGPARCGYGTWKTAAISARCSPCATASTQPSAPRAISPDRPTWHWSSSASCKPTRASRR